MEDAAPKSKRSKISKSQKEGGRMVRVGEVLGVQAQGEERRGWGRMVRSFGR